MLLRVSRLNFKWYSTTYPQYTFSSDSFNYIVNLLIKISFYTSSSPAFCSNFPWLFLFSLKYQKYTDCYEMNMLLSHEICTSPLFCVCNPTGLWMDKKDREAFTVSTEGTIFDDIWEATLYLVAYFTSFW